MDFPERVRPGLVEAERSCGSFRNQVGVQKDFQILGDGRHGDIEMGGYLLHRQLVAAEQIEQLAAVFVGDSVKYIGFFVGGYH
mgnify:CR=1 FL=1